MNNDFSGTSSPALPSVMIPPGFGPFSGQSFTFSVYRYVNIGDTKSRFDLVDSIDPEYPEFTTVGLRSKTGHPSVSLTKPPIPMGKGPHGFLTNPLGRVVDIFVNRGGEPDRWVAHGGYWDKDFRVRNAVLVGRDEAFLDVIVFSGMGRYTWPLLKSFLDGVLELPPDLVFTRPNHM